MANQHLIAGPSDPCHVVFDTALVRSEKHDALVWGKNGFKTHRRAGFTLRDGSDDPEAMGSTV